MSGFDSELNDLLKMPRWAGVRVAFVFAMMAVAILATTVLWGMNSHIWSAAPTNLLSAALFLGLGWGCFLLKRWAFWVSAVLSGLYTASFIYFMPGAIEGMTNLASALTSSRRDAQTLYVASFTYMAFMIGVLMLIAFGLLMTRQSREAFGIGKFASNRK